MIPIKNEMEKRQTFFHIEEDESNGFILQEIIDYANKNPSEQLYVLNTPLGENKYSYPYQNNAMVILSPKHKIMFLDVKGDKDDFIEYYEDFIEDLSSISDKFKYKNHIGRPREWKITNTVTIQKSMFVSIPKLLEENRLNSAKLRRASELLISLLIGSINDISKVGADVPKTLLEKVKKNILLFDGEQTRFIYKEFGKKSISVQGLSGTGKTELLLHKLKELYISEDDSRIFFTCHNIALANNLRERIPQFFNFMKVEKQIEWNERLWVTHAWGSRNVPNSGMYSYLSNFYNVPFLRYSPTTNYETIFRQILDHVEALDDSDFKYAFDYILIDERQDFPSVFFELCEKIVRKKVFIAGDIFQDIFENAKDIELKVDIVLNRCYRTDPRTLMFAHGISLGLFEKKKMNWFSDAYWESIGYNIERVDKEVHLTREPVRRFEDLKVQEFESVILGDSTRTTDVVKILQQLKKDHEDLKPDDVAIILLEENRKNIYDYIDGLCVSIGKGLGWGCNRAYENKNKIANSVYISNPNNVKGLEFPFVICLTAAIKDTYKYRNILYTMLTRSFIQSYLLVTDNKGIGKNKEGLQLINKKNFIQTLEPTTSEKKEIENKLTKFIQSNENISYEDFINDIFDEMKVEEEFREKFITALMNTKFERFDKPKTKKFIKANMEFYGQ